MRVSQWRTHRVCRAGYGIPWGPAEYAANTSRRAALQTVRLPHASPRSSGYGRKRQAGAEAASPSRGRGRKRVGSGGIWEKEVVTAALRPGAEALLRRLRYSNLGVAICHPEGMPTNESGFLEKTANMYSFGYIPLPAHSGNQQEHWEYEVAAAGSGTKS